MAWKVGESWLDTDVLWFRETEMVAVRAQVMPALALPKAFELPRLEQRP